MFIQYDLCKKKNKNMADLENYERASNYLCNWLV